MPIAFSDSPVPNTATIITNRVCAACGWPIVDTCVSGEALAQLHPGEDYWMYCSNQSCENHNGAGYLQDEPDWCVSMT